MPVIDILVSLVLFLIMLGIGISLSFEEIKIVFQKPKALIVGLSSQMILLPIIAFIIAIGFDIPNYVKIGLVILASSPGGTTSGFITYLFKGNVALSITLTTINSLLTLFSIPVIVNFAIQSFENTQNIFTLPFYPTFREIFILTVLPITIGIVLKRGNNTLAVKLSKGVRPIMLLLLGIVFILKFIGADGKGGITSQEIVQILPFALLLNILCLLTGYFISRLFYLNQNDQITISIESAVHNTTMAFLISGTLLHNEYYGKVSLVYAMFSFWSAILFSSIIKSNFKKTIQ